VTTIVSGGGLVSPGGNLQPFPKSSVPLSAYGSDITLVDGLTVSYAHLWRTQLWVWIATSKMSRQIARLPLKLHRRTSNGRERVRTGPVADVLKRPWARGAPVDLKMAIALPALVHGNAALRKVRKAIGGPPIGVMPLAWSRLRVHGDANGPVEVWETDQPGHPRYIDPDDVIHIAWRGLDGPIGLSPLAALATTVAIEDAATRAQVANWRNGARPPSAIEPGDGWMALEREEREALYANLRTDVDALYGGPDNSGKPAVMPYGVKWNAIGHTAVEAELIAQRKLTREEVGSCYDVPPPLMGLLERSTFNNITELHSMFYVTVLGPWLTMIVEQLGAQWLDDPSVRDDDVYLEFDLSEVLKGDLLKRAQALALQISYGVLTIDEAREIENRATFGLPETSKPLYPSNLLTPVGAGSSAPPSDDQVKDAAQALANMGEPDVQKLLVQSGGSVVEAIFALAGVSSNGSHSESDDDE
jgi:HK97 family phage portal protein